jgi:methyl-accepting chemotaxis protein
MRHLRLRTKIAIAIGVLIVTALLIAGVGIAELYAADNQVRRLVEGTVRKVYACTNMRLELFRAIRAQKNAVISPNDEESRRFIEEFNQALGRANQFRQELAQLIDSNGDRDEKRLLEEVHKDWDELQKISRQVEALSMLNTNPKAAALSRGKVQDQIAQMQEALGLLLNQGDRDVADPQLVKEPSRLTASYKQARLASDTLASVFDLHRLLDLHIGTAKDEEKNPFEEQIKSKIRDIKGKLETLGGQAGEKERGAVDRATAAVGQLQQHLAEALKLSRTNSIYKAAELSLGAYRVALNNLDKAMSDLSEHLRGQFAAEKASSEAGYVFARWFMIAVTLAGIALSLILSLLMTRSITEPIAQSVAVSESIARGDLTHRLRLQQRDEIGQLSAAMNRLASTLARIVGQIHEVSERIDGSAHELHTVSHQMLAQSEEMSIQAGHVASATEQMSTNINTMAAGAEQMSMNVASISSASEEISVNVGTISGSADATARNVAAVARSIAEITRAFQDVAKGASNVSQITNQAMDQAAAATATMNALDRAASEINKVTEVIKMIALQTNLLALNATIEATSAGEAGKGFAVVAHEIKELANQSARAAEDIAQKIEGVQASTRKAVEVIQGVTQIMHTINTSANNASESLQKQTQVADKIAVNVAEASQGVENIATSIAEVAKGTNDMSKNASEAAKGANDMSRNATEAAKGARDSAANIQGVSQATRDNTEGAQKVNVAAEQLARIAGELHKLVGQFKIEAPHE